MWRLYFSFFTLLLSLNLYGWTSGLPDAVKAVANGSATPKQELFVHIHRAEVSQMGLSNSQFQKISAKVEKRFILQNNLRIEKAAKLAGFEAQTKAPKNKFTPGADTDVNVIPKDPNHIITLDDIKAIEANYENMLRAECKKNGLDYDTYKKSRNTDTDFMADPNHTTDEEFKKIADYINNEKGGTAYNTRDAARAELKLAKGQTPTPDEIGAYTGEMKWQMNRKTAKVSKLYKDLADAKKANDFSSVQKISTEIKLVNGQKAKYISKTRQLNNQVRKSYGLEPEPYAIDGADAAADILTAPGGRAAPFSNEASLIGATSDSAMLRAQEKLADSLIEAAQKTPAARRALSGILNELPPSAQGNLISRMEQELGTKAAVDVIQGAKALKAGSNPVIESIKQAMRNDLNFGSPGLALKPKLGALSKTQKVKAAAKYGLRVAMIGATAFFMGQDGVYHALNEVTANQTMAEFAINVYKNAIYYGSGFGYGFDQANAEMQRDYERQLQHGGASSLMKDITVTGIKTVVYMGKNIVVGTMMLPDVIYEYLIGAKEAQRKEEMSKQFLAAVQDMVKTKLQVKNAEKMGKKVGIHAEDMLAFKECLCNSSSGGGMLGNHYGPGRGGACIASGPLSSWHIPMQINKSSANECSNTIAKVNAAKNKKIFDKMHKEEASARKEREKREQAEIDEALYKKLVQMVQDENAKCAQKQFQEVKQLMQKDETLVKAAQLFERIKPLLYKNDKGNTGTQLWRKLLTSAGNKEAYGDLRNAVYEEDLACKVADINPKNDPTLTAYKKWEKSWSEAKSKQFPKIDYNTSKGNLITAKALLEDLGGKMIPQLGFNKLPYAKKDPRYIALKNQFEKKHQEYQTIYNDSYLKIQKFKKERNPRSALKLVDMLLENWQHKLPRQNALKRDKIYLEKLLKLAKQHAKTGDMYKKYPDYANAVKQYRASLGYQKDNTIQRKLDDLLKRHKTAISLQKDGDKQLKKHKLSRAISQYKRSVKYWQNSDLNNLINRLKQQLEREKRKAELKAKIAKLEREKARQEEKAMTNDGLDFGNRFGARETQRSDKVEEKKMRDAYTDNTDRSNDQEEMLERLKQNLEKIKATTQKTPKPVAHAPIPQKTSHPSSVPNSTVSKQPTATSTPTTSSQSGQGKTKPTNTVSKVNTTAKLEGTWRGKSSCCTASGTFTMQLFNKGKVFIVTKGDMDMMFDGTVSKSGVVKVAFITPENEKFRLDGKVTKNANGNYTGKGTWNDDEYRGTWKVTRGHDVTQATQTVTKVKKPSKTTSISTTGWDGLYLGYYKDDRNKGCTDNYGKLSIIIKGNRFSGDGSGTIDSKGKLSGRFNNGYKASGRIVYGIVQGWISGKPHCNAYLELRKDKTGRKKYIPAKKVVKPSKKLQVIAAAGVSGSTLSRITLGLDSGMSQLIKLHITQASERRASGKSDSARIGEVEFYSFGKKVRPSSVHATSNFNHGYSAQQVIDGNLKYRYMTSGAKGWASSEKTRGDDWLTFKFSKPVNITKVIVTTAPTRPYRLYSFSIEKYN